MELPVLSPYMMARKPSGIRMGQIKFLERKNPPILVNGSIGNVMRPMHNITNRTVNQNRWVLLVMLCVLCIPPCSADYLR